MSKKEIAKASLEKQTPNDEESDLIHSMWLEQQEFQGTNCTSTLTKGYKL